MPILMIKLGERFCLLQVLDDGHANVVAAAAMRASLGLIFDTIGANGADETLDPLDEVFAANKSRG
jgi:hypothetical protein